MTGHDPDASGAALMSGRYRGHRDRARDRSADPCQPDPRRGRGALRPHRGRAVRRRGRPPRPVRGRGARGDLDGDLPVPPPGASTFVDCTGEIPHATLNGVDLDPATVERGRLPLPDLQADNVLVVAPPSPTPPAATASSARSTQRQARLPVDHASSPTWPACLGELRPARPQGRARVHRQRPRHLDGAQQLRAHVGRRPARRRAALDVRRHAAALDVRHGGQRRPVLRDARASRRLRPRPVLPSVPQGPARPRCRGAVRADRAGPGLVRREVRRAVRPGEVRPGLRARHGWRDGELGLRDVGGRRPLPQHAHPRPAPPGGRRSCCTRWRTCGSATW